LINPQNYTIRKNDIGYVVCDNHEDAINIKLIASLKSPSYKKFLENYQAIKEKLGEISSRKSAIEEMVLQLLKKDNFEDKLEPDPKNGDDSNLIFVRKN
jgi:hypothetical protein